MAAAASRTARPGVNVLYPVGTGLTFFAELAFLELAFLLAMLQGTRQIVLSLLVCAPYAMLAARVWSRHLSCGENVDLAHHPGLAVIAKLALLRKGVLEGMVRSYQHAFGRGGKVRIVVSVGLDPEYPGTFCCPYHRVIDADHDRDHLRLKCLATASKLSVCRNCHL